MTIINISKRKKFKVRRDGQIINNTNTAVLINSGAANISNSGNLDTSNFARLLGDNTFNGNLTINGTLIQAGSSYQTQIEEVLIKNNLNTINSGQVGTGVSGLLNSTKFAGWKVDRGTENPFYWGFNEDTDRFVVGKSDSLRRVATIQDIPIAGYPVQYNSTTHSLESVSAVRDSLKLGGRIATDYWHKDNSNKSDIDWSAKNLDASNVSITGTTGQPTFKATATTGNPMFRLIDDDNDWSLRTDGNSFTVRDNRYAKTPLIINRSTGKLLSYYSGGLKFETTSTGTKTTGNHYVSENLSIGAAKKIHMYGDGSPDYIDYRTWNVITSGDLTLKNTGSGGLTLSTDNINRLHITHGGAVQIANTIGSLTFSNTGFTGAGWQITKSGDAVLDNLTVRKSMNVYEMNINKIRSGNGSYWFSDGAKVKEFQNKTAAQNIARIILDKETDNPFRVGDVLRCQVWTGSGVKYYTFKVQWMGTTAQGDFIIDDYMSSWTQDLPEAGDEIVRIGNATNTDRQGAVYITSNDNDAPYIDIVDGVISDSLVGKTKARYGKLDGITDTYFGNLTGYGLYAENAFLTGGINASLGKIGNWAITDTLLSSADGRTTLQSGIDQGLAIRKIAGNSDDMVRMYYYSDTDWGVGGRTGSNWTFQLGSTNQIAGCNFDSTHVWTSDKWSLNSDGSGYLAKNNISWDSSGNVTLAPSVKMSWGQISESFYFSHHYKSAVILLIPYYDGTTLNESEVIGQLTFRRGSTGASNRTEKIDISAKSAYNTTHFSMSKTAVSWNWKFVKCLYKGKYWLALRSGSNVQDVRWEFWGKRTLGSNTGYSQSDQFKVVAYLQEGNPSGGNGVLDSEINNSLTYVTGGSISDANGNALINSSTATSITESTVTAAYINAFALNASSITTGTLSASRIATGSLNANKITAGTITATEIDTDSLKADLVTAANVNALALSASSITTGTLSASRIDTDTLVVKNLKTATSGKRMELSASANNFRFFNVANVEVLKIDDSIYSGTAGIKMIDGVINMTGSGVGTLDTTKIYKDKIQSLSVRGRQIVGGVTYKSGSSNYNTLNADYRFHFINKTAHTTIYLPSTSGVEDGTEIIIFNVNNYDAKISARSGALWNGSSTYYYYLNDNGNSISFVKYNNSWYKINIDNSGYKG